MEYAQRLTSTRGGTLILALLASLIAGTAVFVYVRDYRQSVEQGGTPATVLVAKSTIAKGTPGELVAAQGLFRAQTIRESQLSQGAVADTAALSGRVARADILPGTQLSVADFELGAGTIASKLQGSERAITIPIDSAHGMIGQIHGGDRVDVYGGFNLNGAGQTRPMLRLLMQNVPVLVVNKADAQLSESGANAVTIQATAAQTAKLAFTADNGKVWLVLRPAAGAKPSPPDLVTVETLMLGVPPVTALRSLGGAK